MDILAKSYVDFCEMKLWSPWLAASLALPKSVSDRFQLKHAPEPYLRFGEGTKPLYVVLTNPGAGRPHQCRDNVTAGQSCINGRMPYYDAALALGDYYAKKESIKGEKRLKAAPRGRINAMLDLKKLTEADCVVQFESLPFHSKSLPGKRRLSELVVNAPLLCDYASVLTQAIHAVSVVALSAVDSSKSISRQCVSEHPWLKWQADLMGINPEKLETISLATKNGKTTSAMLFQRIGDCTRGFVLTMGSNSFPGQEGRKKIADRLNSSAA